MTAGPCTCNGRGAPCPACCDRINAEEDARYFARMEAKHGPDWRAVLDRQTEAEEARFGRIMRAAARRGEL